MKNEVVCAVCSSQSYKPLYKGLVQCQSCEFVWADCRISDAELKEMYARNYFFGGEYRDYLEEKAALCKDFRRNLDIMLPFTRRGRLLELGSAYGFSLDLAKPHFDEVTGVDMNPEGCEYAKNQLGLNAICGDFLTLQLPENHYDVVSSWATLEHLQYPDLYMEKIFKLLKPGGIFVFTTCDRDAFIPRVRKSKWRLIHPPTHVSYFSRKTLERLLLRFSLKPVLVDYVGQNRSFDSVLYAILVLINKWPRLYSFAKKIGLTRGTFYLNTYDTIYMVARKVG